MGEPHEQDEAGSASTSSLLPDGGDGRVPLEVDGAPDLDALEARSSFATFRIETFPAGMRFATWLRAAHMTGEQLAFLDEVLQTFAENGRIGGRTGIGHGMLTLDLRTKTVLPQHLPDWRAPLLERREEVLEVLRGLS